MSTREDREEALRALESRDWTGAVVDREERRGTTVFSVRLDGDLTDILAAEATRRGTNPSEVLRDLVESLRPVAEEAVVTVRVADLHRAIDKFMRQAA